MGDTDVQKMDERLEKIYERASAGEHVTVEECGLLQEKLDPLRQLPVQCSQVLRKSSKGQLVSRDSRVQRTWKRGEHGLNRLSSAEFTDASSRDSVSRPDSAQSFTDIYMASKTPEEQQKIRRLHVRTASKGVRPRVNYEEWTGDPENQHEVVTEVRKELVRRASRRKESKSSVVS